MSLSKSIDDYIRDVPLIFHDAVSNRVEDDADPSVDGLEVGLVQHGFDGVGLEASLQGLAETAFFAPVKVKKAPQSPRVDQATLLNGG